MAIRTRTQLKSYFETGDRPTEEQFSDFIDSVLLPNDTDDIDELKNILKGETIYPLLAEFTEESLTYDTDEYLMIPRITKNPINGVLIMCYSISEDHTTNREYFFLRRSTDNGNTWTGVNGTGTQTKVDISQYGRNFVCMYTNTGRLLIIFNSSGAITSGRYQTQVIYSDDDGLTFSDEYQMTWPNVSGTLTDAPPYFWVNNAIYNEDGNLLCPYHIRVTETGRAWIGIAVSDDDGETWDLNYSFAYDGHAAANGEPMQMSWVDCGDGIFIMLSIWFAGTEKVPVMMVSKDYGLTWDDGTGSLTYSDLSSGNHLSGFLYLEGPGRAMGTGTYNLVHIDMNMIEYGGEKWLVIPFYTRDDGIDDQDLKLTMINVREYLLNGVNSVKADNVNLPYLIHDYPDNGGGTYRNGGDGASVVINDEILITNYNQVTSSAVTTDLATVFISKAIIRKMVEAYNDVGLNTNKTITFNGTESVMDFSKSKSAQITLTGNVTLLTIDNLPDQDGGEIIIIQNGTGGYGIAAVENGYLTTKYLDGNAPTAANINSGANAHTVLSFKRFGLFLYVTFGKFD